MNEGLEKLSAILLRPEERAGAHAGVFERLGFSEPVKAASLWGTLVQRAGLSAPPGDAGSAIEAHVSHLIEELAGCPDPDMALLNLSRFVDAVISPSQFFGSLLLEKPLIHLLVVIFSCSYYLSDILVRNPVYISWLIARETLESFKSYRVYRDELYAQTSPFTDQRRRLNSIKRYRRRELLRIGTRDLLGIATVEEVTAELSFLADAVIGAVTRLAYDEEARKAGIKQPGKTHEPGDTRKIDTPGASGEDAGEQQSVCFEWDVTGTVPFQRFAVISLGKLGGSELNYSSDIDLMYICDAAVPLEEQTFYTAFARRITADLTEPTEEGYLYRVDLRLRPDGESGPLVVTTEEHVNYLIRRGRPWERQALLKARSTAGNCAVADTFIDNCNRVVFSTLGDDNPLPDILTLRERVIAQLPPEERSRNIKLMSGGIRDIEFITQALQLVHGRVRPEVRSRNTLEALERLHHYGLLEDEVLESLSRCYRLFRTVEHRLQMLLDVRTHTLPERYEELERLGARIEHSALDFVSAGTFRTELGRAIRQVQKLFDAFFRDQEPGEIPLILSLPPGEKEVSRALACYGIREGETAHRFLSSLVYGDFPHLEHPDTLHTAAASLPVILEEVGRTSDPTLALKNLVRIVKSTGAVRSTLELLGEGGDLLRLMLVIAALSTKLTDVISHRPELLDALALGFKPGEPPKDAKDEDALGHGLKGWYEEMLLYIHCQHPIPENGPDVLGPLFSDALEESVTILFDASGGRETNMALFALGSLAGRRCRLGSDLDLLAVIPDGADPRPTADVLRCIMAGTRRAGIATVDPRLRGEGEGSPLAQTLAYYRHYFESRADFWELLTFSRCRFLCGDRDTGRSFDSIVGGFHERDDVKNNFRAEFLASRERLERLSKGAWDVKHAPGGLYDINFLLASVNLLFPPGGRGAFTWEDSIEILQSKGLLQPEEIDYLVRTFKLYYLAQHAAALHGIAYPPLPEREAFLDTYLTRLLSALARETEERFTGTLERSRKDTRNIFTHYIDRI
jgi:glutamate-ammonia-ligase adenylyltransferase